MEDFKQYLSEDSDDSERIAAEKVRQGLAGLRLEQKVAEVAAERQALQRKRFWIRTAILVATLVAITGVALLIFEKKEILVPPVEPPKLKAPMPPQQQPELKRENGQIAQQNAPKQLPLPRFPAPRVRGQNNDDQAWKDLLDKIWYTEYPLGGMNLSATFERADQLLKTRDFNNAYVQLQRLERKMPENDTLRFLKGYCLMEMGEGGEALTYFEKLEGKQPTWGPTLQWYQGLSILVAGDKENALRAFQVIASNPSHPYVEPSKKAIQLLK